MSRTRCGGGEESRTRCGGGEVSRTRCGGGEVSRTRCGGGEVSRTRMVLHDPRQRPAQQPVTGGDLQPSGDKAMRRHLDTVLQLDEPDAVNALHSATLV